MKQSSGLSFKKKKKEKIKKGLSVEWIVQHNGYLVHRAAKLTKLYSFKIRINLIGPDLLLQRSSDILDWRKSPRPPARGKHQWQWRGAHQETSWGSEGWGFSGRSDSPQQCSATRCVNITTLPSPQNSLLKADDRSNNTPWKTDCWEPQSFRNARVGCTYMKE